MSFLTKLTSNIRNHHILANQVWQAQIMKTSISCGTYRNNRHVKEFSESVLAFCFTYKLISHWRLVDTHSITQYVNKFYSASLIIWILRALQVHKVLLQMFMICIRWHNYNIKAAKQVWMDWITGLSTWNKINTKLKFPMVFVNSVCTVQWNNMEHIYIYISSLHS